MYNEERKLRFIEEVLELEGSRAFAKAVFVSTADMEFDLDMDLCAFSVDDYINAVSIGRGLRQNTFKRRLSFTRRYVQWCVDNGFPEANPDLLAPMELKINDLTQKTVRDPQDLQDFLDSIFEPESNQRYDNVYRAYCWLAFIGFEEKDAIALSIDHVITKPPTIRYNDDNYPIYKQAEASILNCVHLSEFKRNFKGVEKYVQRVSGRQLLRGMRKEAAIDGLRNELSRNIAKAIKEHKTDRRLTYFKIRQSGIFYRLYVGETRGVEPDFAALVYQLYGDEIYSWTNGARRRFNVKKMFEADYNNWKDAFSL